MAQTEKSPSRITTGPVVLSYPFIFKPRIDPEHPDRAPKYDVKLLIDKKTKDGKETIAKMKAAIKAVEKKYIAEKNGGKPLKRPLKNTLKDGDVDSDREEDEGKFYVNVGSNRKPPVVDRNLNPITDAERIYSGVVARVCLNCYFYDVDKSKGITFGLESIQYVKDGERLGGGGSNVEDDFGDDYEFDDDEDYDDSEEDEDYDL